MTIRRGRDAAASPKPGGYLKVVVLGAGLTGLSTAYHYPGDIEVYERDPEPGGVAGTTNVDGFAFDHTGHLLHFKDPRVRLLLDELLPGAFARWDRRASIWRDGVKTEYPFQVNTYGHAPQLVADCVTGFVEALVKAPVVSPPKSFADFVLQTFGEGFAEHFFMPYNEKFWRRDLSEITADWVSWAIPRPELRQVIEGALGVVRRGLGYNPSFEYPKQGGIGQLPLALAGRVPRLHLGATATSVDTRARRVGFADGRSVAYDRLVSTLPLPTLLAMSDLPPGQKELARTLTHVGVLNFNLGISRPGCWPDHWTYFPEPDLPFYRVGVPTNFSDGVAPPGTSSLYVEVTYRPESPPDVESLWPEVLAGLERVGIVRSEREIKVRHVVRIPHAYVVFNEDRARAVPELLSALDERSVLSVGRYGAWEYSSMEKALLDGMETAARLMAAH